MADTSSGAENSDGRVSDEASELADLELLQNLSSQPMPKRLGGYIKLSGPGWLQSAITLGGGSLASSLYLGVLAGFSLLWVQPIAMILGIVMLSAIGYVTLSTQERPFQAINKHINPVLGWGWALAVAAANIVWCLPQYSLASSVLRQNLLPSVLGDEGSVLGIAASSFGSEHWMASNAHNVVIVSVIFIVSTVITFSYDRGGRGLKLYELILKLMVASIVLSFMGVLVALSIKGQLDWGAIFAGLIPDFSKFSAPAATFEPLLSEIGEVGSVARDYWTNQIVTRQRDVMIAAAATAVGINMTFLYPYSLLRKKWQPVHRGLAMFDLSTGMFIPYVIATSCVVVAAGSQFHANVENTGFVVEAEQLVVPDSPELKKAKGAYEGILKARDEALESQATLAEQKMAALLVARDTQALSSSLVPLTGKLVSDFIFGFGVLAMTLSTISILMLISGFVVCEILNLPDRGWVHKLGMLIAGAIGALGPFVWGAAGAYLAVPTSVFGFVLLPFAYITFFLMMNQKKLLGENAPRGIRKLGWNLMMGIAAGTASVGSVYMIWTKVRWNGIAVVVGFIFLAILVHFNRVNGEKHGRSS